MTTTNENQEYILTATELLDDCLNEMGYELMHAGIKDKDADQWFIDRLQAKINELKQK